MRNVITDRERLESLTTPRLLAYKNSLLTARAGDDWDAPHGCTRVHKQQEEWRTSYEMVKDILSHRDHVVRKK